MPLEGQQWIIDPRRPYLAAKYMGELWIKLNHVSREAMAAFMRRFSQYIDAEDGTPGQADNATTADDADTLDGLDSTDLAIHMWAQTLNTETNTFPGTSSNVEVNSVNIEAPTSGFLVISGTVYFNNNSGSVTNDVDVQAMLDGSSIPGGIDQATTRLEADLGGHDAATLSYTVTIPVTAGSHTVSQEIDPGSTSDWFYNGAYLTVIFYPESAGSLDTLTSSSASSLTPGSGVDGG